MSSGPHILIIPFFLTIILVFLCAYVIGQKRRSPVKRAFLYFAGTLLFISIIEFLFRLNISHQMNFLISRIGLFPLLCIGFFYMHFMFSFTSTPPNKVYRALRVLVLVVMAVSLIPGTFTIIYPEPFSKIPVAQFAPPFAAALGATVLVPSFYGALLCIKRYRETRIVREKQILRLLLWGIFASLTIGLFVFVVVPFALPDFPEIYLFSSIGSLVHFAYMYVAVAKYHFLSVDMDEIEQVTKTLFANSMDAVVVVDSAGDIVQANEQAKHIFGQSITTAVIQRMIPGYQLSEEYDKWRTKLVDDNLELQIVVSQSPIGVDDQRSGKLLLIRDITDIVQMERHLQEAEKLKSIGLLAGGVAHDFNNQLMSIMGNADLLQFYLSDNKKLQKHVNDILTSSQRAADLTSQLLAFARKGNYLKVPVDLHSLINEVAALLKRSVDKRLEIALSLEANPSYTQGDPSQLQSAILNLALNARDAMGKSGTMTFSTKIVNRAEIHTLLNDQTNKSDIFVLVSVADTGEGIDDETLQRVFEPFFTTKETGLGTGMGLAAVHGTVENHQGAIAIDSKTGQGTTVHVYLPACTEKQEEATPRESPPPPPPKPGRVLVVDDEPQVREVTAKMLESLNYRVTLCSDGEEALTLYQREWKTLDLIIVDLVMPRLSGLELVGEMRKIHPEAKILIVSGHNKGADQKGFRGIGEDGFLQKPFDNGQLLKAIAAL